MRRHIKLCREKDDWHITGNFQGNTILDYHYYEQQKGSTAFVLKRKSAGCIKVYDNEEVKTKLLSVLLTYLVCITRSILQNQ